MSEEQMTPEQEIAEMKQAELFYRSAYEQADKTLGLILAHYAAHDEHPECGPICKINAVEGLLEHLTAEQPAPDFSEATTNLSNPLWTKMVKHAEGTHPDLDAIAKQIVDAVWQRVREGQDGEMWLDNLQAIAAVKTCVRRLRAGAAPSSWQGIIGTAAALVDRLHLIHDHPNYQAVWGLAQVHSEPYAGPKYDAELKALEDALAASVGTWGWAFQQLDMGHWVERASGNDEPIVMVEGVIFYAPYEPHKQLAAFCKSDFEAQDWQLAPQRARNNRERLRPIP